MSLRIRITVRTNIKQLFKIENCKGNQYNDCMYFSSERMNQMLKGQSNEISFFCVFFKETPHRLFSWYLKAFGTWLQIWGNICDFQLVLAIISSGETYFPDPSWQRVTILHVLYNRYLLIWLVQQKLCLLIKAESQHSLYGL